MKRERYYHTCPVCGRKRRCLGSVLMDYGKPRQRDRHEIRCSTACADQMRGKEAPGEKGEVERGGTVLVMGPATA